MEKHRRSDISSLAHKEGIDPSAALVVGKHYPALDGMRGIAILMVVLFHASKFSYEMVGAQLSGINQYYYVLSIIGETGVDLFFVLSGFLITGILIDTHKVKNSLKKFYIRRSLRILPLYYALFTLILCFSIFFSKDGGDIVKISMHFLYLQNWALEFNYDIFMYMNHTWSLAIEEQFYIFWPVLFLFFYRKSPLKAIFLCLVLVLISWAVRIFLSDINQYKLAYTYTFSRMDTLCLGAVLSVFLVHYKVNVIRYMDVLRYIMCFMILSLLVCLFMQERIIDSQQAMIRVGMILCALFYTMLLAYVFLSTNKSFLTRFFSLIYLRKIGRVSYGMYVFHSPIMLLMGKYLYDYNLGFWTNHLLLLIGGGAITFLMASLSYNYFEKPILLLKEKYAPMKRS